MTPEAFAALRQAGYTHVPVMREVLADLDTPLSTYLKLAEGPYSYLFESVQGGEKWGRYSIIGLPCRQVIKVSGGVVSLLIDGHEVEREKTADPLSWIDAFRARFRAAPHGLPRFSGGLVGYFGYDTCAISSRGWLIPASRRRHADILLMLSERVVVFDNLAGKLYIVLYVDPTADDAWRARSTSSMCWARLDEVAPRRRGDVGAERSQGIGERDFVSEFSRERFEAAVDRIKEYIVDGDVMQVVLSQRLSIPYQASPLDLYRGLRSLNPSPYMYYLDLGDFHIVGSSPEILVRLEDDLVTVRPIAGTRPRGGDEAHDRELEHELLADPKERAEHLMLIDLGRNDAGRVARTGSVQLTERMVIERYSHVMHIVSNDRSSA